MRTIVDILATRVNKSPEHIGFKYVNDDGSSAELTYSLLWNNAHRLVSEWTRSKSAIKRLAICMPSGLEFVTSVYACLIGGITAIPLTPPIRKDFVERCLLTLADCSPDLIVTVPALADTLKQIAPSHDIFVLGNWEVAVFPIATETTAYPAADIAVLQYTSATGAGQAKGVMLSHSNLLHNLSAIEDCMDLSRASIMASWLPPYHVMQFIGSVMLPVYCGFRSVLMSPNRFRTEPVEWLKMIMREKATISGGPNQALELCAQSISDEQLQDVDLSSWKVCYCGSEPIDAATLDSFASRFKPYGFSEKAFFPCYGLAESTLIVSGRDHHDPYTVALADRRSLEKGQLQRAERSDPRAKAIVSCGKPCQGVDVKIIDPTSNKELTTGQIGEIHVRSSSVALGYWKRPGLTGEVFGVGRNDGTSHGYLKTGDLGCFFDQELYVTGRLGNLIIIWGRKLHPEDLERCVNPPKSNPAWGRTLVASNNNVRNPGVLVLQEVDCESEQNLSLSAQLIRERLRTESDIHASQVAFIPLNSLPLTITGKIRRNEATAKFTNGDFPVTQFCEVSAS
jgi:acyl-CoA synthetase (AMP-forming)/AMP-acid ligase II